MKYVAVMPWVVSSWAQACIDTCKLDVMLIDNSVTNRGCPRSWNMGIDRMRDMDADWLILLSAAIRFGAAGGLDMLEHCENNSGWPVLESAGIDSDVLGWHLIAFSRECVDTVGRFDENFYPATYEDWDYALRIRRTLGTWVKVPVDATDVGTEHACTVGGVKVDDAELRSYWRRKWGVDPQTKQDPPYALPFKYEPLGFWPPKEIAGVMGLWDRALS